MRRAILIVLTVGLLALAGCAPPQTEPPIVFSTTWISEDTGWVLAADASCSSTCAGVLFRTDDGGQNWVEVDGLLPRLQLDAQSLALEPQVRFENERDGWITTPELWSTHDGGETWTQVDLDGPVSSLEASEGTVHAAVVDSSGVRVWTSPVDTDDFTPSADPATVGAGPVPSTELVVAGDRGWMVVNNRVVVSGLELLDGSWTAFSPPCLDRFGPVELVASSTDVVALCNEGVMGTVEAPGFHLYASDDEGETFTRELPLPDAARGSRFELRRPEEGVFVLVVESSQPAAPVAAATVSTDDGTTWSNPVEIGDGITKALVFASPDRGVVIVDDQVFQSVDGGLTWTELAVPEI